MTDLDRRILRFAFTAGWLQGQYLTPTADQVADARLEADAWINDLAPDFYAFTDIGAATP